MSSMAACPICYEIFKTTDDVYSTSCGHVYHFACMQQWKARSTSCPQCREYNPTSHKVYFSFEADAATNKKLEEIQKNIEGSEINLKQMEKNNSEMQLELDDKARMILVLKNEMETLVTNISLLESKLEESEEKLLKLNSQCDESIFNGSRIEHELELLRKEITLVEGAGTIDGVELIQLKVQLKMMERAIQEKDDKIQFLYLEKYKLEEALKAAQNNAKPEMKLMEEQLKLLTEKLLNENNNNAIAKAEEKKGQKLQKAKNQKKKKENNPNAEQLSSLLNVLSVQDVANAEAEHAEEEEIESEKQTKEMFGNVKNSVIIKGITGTIEESKYKLIIIKLAALMGFNLTENDICAVKMMVKKRNNLHNKITLCVEFKEYFHKIKFIKLKGKLRTYPETMSLIIYEFTDEKTLALYHLAKVLKTFGYKVYFRQNVVYASKNTRIIRINCSQQVHALLRSEKEQSGRSTPTVLDNGILNLPGSPHLRSNHSSTLNFLDSLF